MQPWFDLLEEVLPEVEGVPTALAERACIRAARKLCDHAPIIQDTVSTDAVIDQTSYEFVVTADHDVVVPLKGWFDGRAMHPLAELYPWGDGREAPYTYQAHRETVNLLWRPVANITDGIRFTFSLKPSFLSEQGDDCFFDDCREAITEGALAHLMMMPGREWSNEKLGPLHAAAFTGEIQQANGRYNKRGTTANVSVRMRPHARGGRHHFF